jgi:FkbM family methyltransferase
LRVAQFVHALPEFRGRDRLLAALLRPGAQLDATILGTFGGGLRFEGNPAADSNLLHLLTLRFARPALAPVLDAALAPAGVFADVGANLGLYTLWGARLDGTRGCVHAFEPVPEVRRCLERNVALNGFRQVRVVAAGLSAETGRLTLYRMLGSSGVTSRYLEQRGEPVKADVTTLDAEFADATAGPDLAKINVEGMELEVLRGARRLLTGHKPPLVVFESSDFHFRSAGTSYREVQEFLAASGGYEVFALRPHGLREEPRPAETPGSTNVLAARRDHLTHRQALDRLARVCFARNMNQ